MAEKTEKIYWETAALIVVDVQNDFCPKGSLAVKDGDKVVPTLNRMIRRFKTIERPVIATRDWHPEDTKHFKNNGGIWPPHCVQNTKGADFHKDLLLPLDTLIGSKGMEIEEDEKAYSGFGGRVVAPVYDPLLGWVDIGGFGLEATLFRMFVDTLFVGGLATDYCVKATVLDALRLKFKVYLLKDACRAVNLKPGDGKRALAEMEKAGAIITTVRKVLKNV